MTGAAVNCSAANCFIVAAMVYASHRLLIILGLVAPLACASGDGASDDDASAGTSAAATTLGAGSSSSSGPGSSGEPTTAAVEGTSTDDATTLLPTTGDDTTTTTGDDTTGSTGPICEPGAGNCVCDNGTCVDGYVCDAGVCVEMLLCPGEEEFPGDSETTPKDLGDITDNDDDFFNVKNVLSGADDVDWYVYDASDTLGYIAEPTVKLIGGTQRMCQFMLCANGNAAMTEVNCPEGSKFAISPMLRPGCCAETGVVIKDLNCSGQDESARVWVRIDQPAVDACSPYEIDLHF